MKIVKDISDESALKELGSRIARYRLNKNLTQAALATEAGVSRRTVVRVEQGESTQAINFIRILRALRLFENLEALIPEPAISPVERLKLRGKVRQRASAQQEGIERKEPWSWGEDK